MNTHEAKLLAQLEKSVTTTLGTWEDLIEISQDTGTVQQHWDILQRIKQYQTEIRSRLPEQCPCGSFDFIEEEFVQLRKFQTQPTRQRERVWQGSDFRYKCSACGKELSRCSKSSMEP